MLMASKDGGVIKIGNTLLVNPREVTPTVNPSTTALSLDPTFRPPGLTLGSLETRKNEEGKWDINQMMSRVGTAPSIVLVKRPRRNESLLFSGNYFKRLRDQTKVCLTCRKTYSKSTGNSTLELHLEKHDAQYEQYKAQKAEKKQKVDIQKAAAAATSGSGSSTTSLLTHPNSSVVSAAAAAAALFQEEHKLWQSIMPKRDLGPTAALAWAMNSLPYYLLDDTYFREFLEAYRNSPIRNRSLLSRKSIISEIELRSHSTEERVIGVLRERPITFAVDGWTECRYDKTINFVGLSGGKAFYWDSMTLRESGDTEGIARSLLTNVELLLNKGVMVVALVTDNDKVMLDAGQKVCERFPWVICFPCADHSIHLVLKDIFKAEGPIKSADTFLKEFVSIFDYEPNLRKLYQVQISSGRERPLPILKPSSRWRSSYRAMIRIEELKQDSKSVVETKEEDWKAVNLSLKFLKPFSELTDIIQSEDATVVSVYHGIDRCAKLLEDMARTEHELTSTAKTGIQAIKDRWYRNFNSKFYRAAMVIAGNVAHLDTAEAFEGQQFLTTWGTCYLVEKRRRESLSKGETFDGKMSEVLIAATLNVQLCQFMTREGLFQYKEIDSSKPLVFWIDFIQLVPELSDVSITLLTVVPTMAACERSFSHSKTVHHALRNRINERPSRSETLLKMNHNVFEKVRVDVDECEELSLTSLLMGGSTSSTS